MITLEVSLNSEAHKMNKLNQERDGAFRVIKLTQSNGKQISLLASDERIFCYQSTANDPWVPIEDKYLDLAVGINRMRNGTKAKF